MGSGKQDRSAFLESGKSVVKSWETKWAGGKEPDQVGQAKGTSSFLKGLT